jgi:hypothetical protein
MASVGRWSRLNNAAPSLQPHYRAFLATTGCSAPANRFGTFALAIGTACGFSLSINAQVRTFRASAWLRFAPPTCRMPLGQYHVIPRADLEGRVSPRFRHRLISFRHFIGGLLAFASLNRACRDLVPAFPQRSPPWYLATAACGGLRSAHDCRPRRALLHHSHSWAPPMRRRRFRVTRPIRDLSASNSGELLAKDVNYRSRLNRMSLQEHVRCIKRPYLAVRA